ncbi:MAG: ABC transporter ATP-binding protein [Erysipelotrichaceae bacterium]
MNTVIQYIDILKKYNDKTILKNINISIEKGDFVSIIGASGSGKTTLLKMTNGLVTPTSGKILIHNEDISTINQDNLRRNMGYAIQGGALFPHMTIFENIAYVPNLLNKKDKKRTLSAVKKWTNIMQLDETIFDRYPHELSGGQQQRVGIARSLAASPDILLMDEPFGAVDEITKKQLQDELIKVHHQTNITILFVTHDIKEALRISNKLLILQDEEIVQFDTVENILNNPKNEYVSKLLLHNNIQEVM